MHDVVIGVSGEPAFLAAATHLFQDPYFFFCTGAGYGSALAEPHDSDSSHRVQGHPRPFQPTLMLLVSNRSQIGRRLPPCSPRTQEDVLSVTWLALCATVPFVGVSGLDGAWHALREVECTRVRLNVAMPEVGGAFVASDHACASRPLARLIFCNTHCAVGHASLGFIAYESERSLCDGTHQDFCSAALKIVKDQIEQRSVVVLVLNKESAIWKDASMKTLLRSDQLKYIDVEEMAVVTNNRCVAEQIQSDWVDKVATDGVRIEEFGKAGKRQNFKSIVMDGVKIGRV